MRWPPPPDWPGADHSQQVLCQPHRWHVQETGAGETVILIHGAGGSTHSWRGLVPLLAAHFHVVAFDLPGQGYTQLGARHRCGLDSMAEDIIKLCTQKDWKPAALIGHSAGGALSLRLSERLLSPRGRAPLVIGINPALDTFEGLAGVLFPALAKLLSALPFTAQVFSATTGTPARVQALIRSTGSVLDGEGLAMYQRLVADRDHADATLLMMAQWELTDLLADLPKLAAPARFIVGLKDTTVPPKVSERAAQRMQDAQVIRIDALGHLAHEEDPKLVMQHITSALNDHL